MPRPPEPDTPRPILAGHPAWLDLLERTRASQPTADPARIRGQIHAALDRLPVRLWEDEAAFQDMRRAAIHQLDQWSADPAPAAAGPTPSGPELVALLVGQIIGIRPDYGSGRILWRLSAAPPSGVVGLPWGPHTVDLRFASEAGGGQIILAQTPIPLELDLFTPHTAFAEFLAPGPNRLLLTVLDRTDVQSG